MNRRRRSVLAVPLSLFSVLLVADSGGARAGERAVVIPVDDDGDPEWDRVLLNLNFHFAAPPAPDAAQGAPLADYSVALAEEQLKRASAIICDASEGHVRIANVYMGTSPRSLAQADLIWIPDGAKNLSGGTQSQDFGTEGNIVRLAGQKGIRSMTIAHELGHSFFRLADLYDKQRLGGRAFGFGRGLDLAPGEDETPTLTSLMLGSTPTRCVDVNLAVVGDACFNNADCDELQNETCPIVPDARSEFLLANDFDAGAGDGGMYPGPSPGEYLYLLGYFGSDAPISPMQTDWSNLGSFAEADAASAVQGIAREFIDAKGELPAFGRGSSHLIRFYFEHEAFVSGDEDIWRMYALIEGDEVGLGNEADEDIPVLLPWDVDGVSVDYLRLRFDHSVGANWIAGSLPGSDGMSYWERCYDPVTAGGLPVVDGQVTDGNGDELVHLEIADLENQAADASLAIGFRHERFGSCRSVTLPVGVTIDPPVNWTAFDWQIGEGYPYPMFGARIVHGNPFDGTEQQQLGACTGRCAAEDPDDDEIADGYLHLWNDTTKRWEGSQARRRTAQFVRTYDGDPWLDMITDANNEPLPGADWDVIDFNFRSLMSLVALPNGLGSVPLEVHIDKPSGAVDPGDPSGFCANAYANTTIHKDEIESPDVVHVLLDASMSMDEDVQSDGEVRTKLDWARAALEGYAGYIEDEEVRISLSSFGTAVSPQNLFAALDHRQLPAVTLVSSDPDPMQDEMLTDDFLALLDDVTPTASDQEQAPLYAVISFLSGVLAGDFTWHDSVYLVTDSDLSFPLAEQLNQWEFPAFVTLIDHDVVDSNGAPAAALHGGEIFSLDHASGVGSSLLKLHGEVRGENQLLPTTSTAVANGNPGLPSVETVDFWVEESADRLLVQLTNGNLDVGTWNPKLLLTGPSESFTEASGEYALTSGNEYGTFTIEFPTPGAWQLKLEPGDANPLEPSQEDQTILAHLEHTGPRCTVGLSPRKALDENEAIVIRSRATFLGGGIETDVTMEATVTRPDGSSVGVPLTAGDDGEFVGRFDDYRGTGKYHLAMSCSVGTDAVYVPWEMTDPEEIANLPRPPKFERHLETSFAAELGHYWFDSPGGDCDGDGFSNAEEGLVWQGNNKVPVGPLLPDSDGDGKPDACDPDSDNDALSDSREQHADTDGDGLNDRVDVDSDSDGEPDGRDPLPIDSASPEEVARGDFNADGFVDWAFGEPAHATGTGRLRLVDGRTHSESYLDRDTIYVMDVAQTGDHFGDAVEAGDIDGDGFDDLVVGVPRDDVGGVTDAGSIQILYGGPSGITGLGDQVLHQDSTGIAGYAETSDRFGDAVTIGDYNCDGYADVGVGAPTEDYGSTYNAGGVHVIYASSTGLTTTDDVFFQSYGSVEETSETVDQFGAVLASGDFDSDTCDDFVVGTPNENRGATDSGLVYVMPGDLGGVDSLNDYTFDQDTAGVAGVSESPRKFRRAV